ncbi:MAG: glycosyltransferase [Patescibacteria group bacterium]
MKILYGITKSNFGGAQRYVFDLATEAQKAGHDVAVLCGEGGVLVEKLREKGVRVIEIKGMKRDIALLDEIRSFSFILRTLAQENPDVFHTNSSKMGGLGNLAARLAGVRKIIFTVHGWPFWEQRNKISIALIRFFSWLTAVFAHKVIVVSDYDLKTGKAMPFVGHKFIRIYNGLDLNMSFDNGQIIREAFSAGVKITGTIGELNHNKNQIALVEEARRDREMYVAIIGEGELRDFLLSKIKGYGLEERVKLFGFIPREKVLKGFDIFALPSLKEGLPYVLLEAKLAGLEIKANPVGGVREILENDINNFSIEKMVSETFKIYL